MGVYLFDSNVIKPYDNKATPETPTVIPTEVTPAVTQHTEDLSAPKIYLGNRTGSELPSPILFSKEQIELFTVMVMIFMKMNVYIMATTAASS